LSAPPPVIHNTCMQHSFSSIIIKRNFSIYFTMLLQIE
jgi:hypothetical protein